MEELDSETASNREKSIELWTDLNEKPKIKKKSTRECKKNLTIRDVAEHTGKIILDSALEFSNWINEFQVISSPEYSIISNINYETEVESDSDGFSMIVDWDYCKQYRFVREIFAKTWPNDVKNVMDLVFSLIKLGKISAFGEKYIWKYLDYDQDGVVTNGDLYECFRRFNIWKLLYELLKAANPHVCSVFRSFKLQKSVKSIEYIN